MKALITLILLFSVSVSASPGIVDGVSFNPGQGALCKTVNVQSDREAILSDFAILQIQAEQQGFVLLNPSDCLKAHIDGVDTSVCEFAEK
ncbi:MAG: hypothetical protein MK008_09825 [Bdellovibrionales bacterium]|nr:hypothetical protein [Bdellovibrionales bacterium]